MTGVLKDWTLKSRNGRMTRYLSSERTFRRVHMHLKNHSYVCCSTLGAKDIEFPRLTLERAIGDKAGSDEVVFKQGRFDGSVYPDLPIIGPSMREAIESQIRGMEWGGSTSAGWVVRTVAAQCLHAADIDAKIVRSGNIFRDKEFQGALLCVSGGDPGRNLPFVRGKLKDCSYILTKADALRQRGEIPETTSLWAVGNPMTDSIDSLKSKVDSGAQVILTQPPFFARTSEQWFEHAQGLPVRVLAGMPVITSLQSMAFWFTLCGVERLSEAGDMMKTFPKTQDEDRIVAWNREFLNTTIRKLPGVFGIHAMPVTKMGTRLMPKILQE